VSGTWTIRSTDYTVQLDLLVALVKARDIAVCVIDETKHPGFVDFARKALRDTYTSRGELVQVIGRHGTHKLKSRCVPELRKAVEKRQLTIDYDSAWEWSGTAWTPTRKRPLLDALLKIEQVLTPSGLVTYDARADAQEGHADAASALLLAHDAHLHSDAPTLPERPRTSLRRRPARPEIIY
jgi:hypothetical protein